MVGFILPRQCLFYHRRSTMIRTWLYYKGTGS